MSAEGVPVAWAVVDRHGVLLPNSNEAAEVACFRTKDEADEELAYANQGEGAPPWEDSKPFAVVALAPTHPAAASAEREGARTIDVDGAAHAVVGATRNLILAVRRLYPSKPVSEWPPEYSALDAALHAFDKAVAEEEV